MIPENQGYVDLVPAITDTTKTQQQSEMPTCQHANCTKNTIEKSQPLTNLSFRVTEVGEPKRLFKLKPSS